VPDRISQPDHITGGQDDLFITDQPSFVGCKACGAILHVRLQTFPEHICKGRRRNMLSWDKKARRKTIK
jgi:hypothetical protein